MSRHPRPAGPGTNATRGHATVSRALLVVAVAALAVLGLAVPAQAHARLVASTPADGAALDVGPSQVVLTFDEKVLDPTIAASNDAGVVVALGSPQIEGTKVTVSWPAGQPAGLYRLGYTVKSDDDHVVQGILLFSYAKASPGTFTGSTAAAEVPGQGPGAPAGQTLAPLPGNSEVPATTSSSGWLLPALVLLGLALLAGGAYAFLRSRRTGSTRGRHAQSSADESDRTSV